MDDNKEKMSFFKNFGINSAKWSYVDEHIVSATEFAEACPVESWLNVRYDLNKV